MPRARIIWPEHLTSPQVARLTHMEYRIWVGLVQLADDEGRCRADVAYLRAAVLPHHTRTTLKNVSRCLHAIAESGLITLYEIDGAKYLFFPSWRRWQKPRFPTKSKLPDPVRYGNPTVSLPESYGTGGVVVGEERNRCRGGVGVGETQADFLAHLERIKAKHSPGSP